MEWVFIVPSIVIAVTAIVTGVGVGLLGTGLDPILLVGISVLGALLGAVVSLGLLLLAASRGPDSPILVMIEAVVLAIVVPIVTTALGILLLARLAVALRDWVTTEAGLDPAVGTVGAVIATIAIVVLAGSLVAHLAREPTVESLTRRLERHPHDPDPLLDRARLYAEQGELDLAISDYTEAIELEPLYLAVLLEGRAGLYDRQDRLDEAIADHTRVIELQPTGTSSLLDRARLFARRGDFDLAIADATAAIELEKAASRQATDYSERGRIYADHGELDLAIADYTRAIGLLASTEASLARSVERQRAADPAYRGSICNDYAWPYVWRGEARAKGGDRDGARADFDHALWLASLGPDVDTALDDMTSQEQRDEIEAVMRSVGLATEASPGS